MVAGKYGPHTDLIEAFLDEIETIDRRVWHRVAELSETWSGRFEISGAATSARYNAAVFSALDSARYRAYRGLKLGPNEFSPKELTALTGARPQNVMREIGVAIETLARWDMVPLEYRRALLAPFANSGFTTVQPIVAEERAADDVSMREEYDAQNTETWHRYGPNGMAVASYMAEISTVGREKISSLLEIVRSTVDANDSLNMIGMSSLPLVTINAVEHELQVIADGLEFDAADEYRRTSTKKRIVNGAQLLAVAGVNEPRWRRGGLMPFAEVGMVSVLGTMMDETPSLDVVYPQNVELVSGFLRQVSRLPHEAWHRLFDMMPPDFDLMAAEAAVGLPLFDAGRRCDVYGEATKALGEAHRESCCEAIWARVAARVRTAAHLLAVWEQVELQHRRTILNAFVTVGITVPAPVLGE